MIDFEFSAVWVTASGNKVSIDKKLLDTLRAIEKHKTMTAACQALGVSYRTLWSLVQFYNAQFEADLIGAAKGSGTKITSLGHQVLWMYEHGRIRLENEVQLEADKLNRQWSPAQPEAPAIKLALSDDPLLPAALSELRKNLDLSVRWGGSIAALSAFHRGEVDIAGCHLPSGASQQYEIHQMMQRWLRGDDLFVMPLFSREMGWISRPSDTPPTFETVLKGQHKLLNRNPASSTYYQLSALANRACINPETLNGWNDYEDSHLALACGIGAGLADLGLGVRYAADYFELQFRAVSWDKYFLVMRDPKTQPQLSGFLEQLPTILEQTLAGNELGYLIESHNILMLQHFLREF